MHPPERQRPREREQFDPIVEGARYCLSSELSLAIWKRVCNDATDSAGRRDEEQARQRFHELAARLAARGGQLQPDPGRVTRVGVELGGARAPVSVADEMRPRTPGRETLVAVEARRWAQIYGELRVAREDAEGTKGPEMADQAMEINGDSLGTLSVDELPSRTPGRGTLVAVDARQWAKRETPTAGDTSMSMAREALGLVPHNITVELTRQELPGASEIAEAMAALQASPLSDQITARKLPTGALVESSGSARHPRVTKTPDLGLDLDQYRVHGLKEVLLRIGPNQRLRHEFIAATSNQGCSIADTSTPTCSTAPWRESQLSTAITNGRALWQVAERHALTLYRRAVNSDAVDEYDPAVESALQQRGTGQLLPMDLRREMEHELGVSLGGVRIHTDAVASQAAHALNAEAFTIGEDIFFAEGAFAPGMRSGRKLLAHELTHVAQALRGNARGTGNGLQVSQPGESLEKEADAVANRVNDEPSEPSMLTHSHLNNSTPGHLLIDKNGHQLSQTSAPANNVILRRSASAEDDNKPIRITVNGQTYLVTRKENASVPDRQPETRFTSNFLRLSQNEVLECKLCRGEIDLKVKLSLNILEIAPGILANVMQHATPLAGITFRPELQVDATMSKLLELTFKVGTEFESQNSRLLVKDAHLTVEVNTRNYGSFGLGARYTNLNDLVPGAPSPIPGAPSPINHQFFLNLIVPLDKNSRPAPPEVDCWKSQQPAKTQVEVWCQRVNKLEESPSPVIPAAVQTPKTTIYALFKVNSDEIIGWRFEGDETPHLPGDAGIRTRVKELLSVQGFLPSSVVGHASPEGPKIKNLRLSRARATAAFNAFFYDIWPNCPTYRDQPIIPRGDGELYGGDLRHGHEIAGPELEHQAVESFVADDPLRPSSPVIFVRQPHAQQVAQTYSLLRRAEIHLERDPMRSPAVRAAPVPSESLGELAPCDDSVKKAISSEPKSKLSP